MLIEFMEISVSQGASQGRSFLARAFDLARPGVAPPLPDHCSRIRILRFFHLFLRYLEMACQKRRKRYQRFRMIISKQSEYR